MGFEPPFAHFSKCNLQGVSTPITRLVRDEHDPRCAEVAVTATASLLPRQYRALRHAIAAHLRRDILVWSALSHFLDHSIEIVSAKRLPQFAGGFVRWRRKRYRGLRFPSHPTPKPLPKGRSVRLTAAVFDVLRQRKVVDVHAAGDPGERVVSDRRESVHDRGGCNCGATRRLTTAGDTLASKHVMTRCEHRIVVGWPLPRVDGQSPSRDRRGARDPRRQASPSSPIPSWTVPGDAREPHALGHAAARTRPADQARVVRVRRWNGRWVPSRASTSTRPISR